MPPPVVGICAAVERVSWGVWDGYEVTLAPRTYVNCVQRAGGVAIVLPPGIDQSRIVVEPPRDAAHGDMATNAAMVLARDAGKKPRELADAIARRLSSDELVARVEVAGPGFINLTLEPGAWTGALRNIPSGRLGRAEDIAAAVRFFCLPESEFTTGQALLVDGGHSLYLHE